MELKEAFRLQSRTVARLQSHIASLEGKDVPGGSRDRSSLKEPTMYYPEITGSDGDEPVVSGQYIHTGVQLVSSVGTRGVTRGGPRGAKEDQENLLARDRPPSRDGRASIVHRPGRGEPRSLRDGASIVQGRGGRGGSVGGGGQETETLMDAGAPGAARGTRSSSGVYGAMGSTEVDSTEEGLGEKGLRSRAVTRDDVVSGINLG